MSFDNAFTIVHHKGIMNYNIQMAHVAYLDSLNGNDSYNKVN